MKERDYAVLLEYLADLSLDAETFEIARTALRLQTLIKEQLANKETQ